MNAPDFATMVLWRNMLIFVRKIYAHKIDSISFKNN